MTRYDFDLRDGDIFIKDSEGLELLNIAKLQTEAAEFLGDMVKDLSMREEKPAGHPMYLEVRQGDEVVLILRLTFSEELAIAYASHPAARGRRAGFTLLLLPFLRSPEGLAQSHLPAFP